MHVEAPPSLGGLVSRSRLLEVVKTPTDPRARAEYLHWDKVRHLDPPPGLSAKEWWWQIKFGRALDAKPLPLTDASGEAFTFSLPDAVHRLLHHIDQQCSGQIAMPEVVTGDEQARQHYLVNSLMEEAIRSSQLEGAATSRKVAKELLRSGRAPKDRSERMILNNYRAIRYMRDEIGSTLTPSAVLELQRILTEGTLEDPSAAGRVQRPDEERIAVVERLDGTVLHAPPPAEQLPARLAAMCAFANEPIDGERFIHPVVRGILLHFWLAYDHPFEDGNGRTARALFYWYMRVHGYWLVEYLSISHILREGPSKYTKAFLLTETDDRDTTYFLLFQLGVIERAIAQFHRYLKRKVSEVRSVERLVDSAAHFNHRQLALLSDALHSPERTYTIGGHANSHDVTHESARTDLTDLADRGLIDRRKEGRQWIFTAPADLGERLNAAR